MSTITSGTKSEQRRGKKKDAQSHLDADGSGIILPDLKSGHASVVDDVRLRKYRGQSADQEGQTQKCKFNLRWSC